MRIGHQCTSCLRCAPLLLSAQCVIALLTHPSRSPPLPGNKADKKAFMSKFGSRGGYVTGRKRANPEMNGKSANVNNVLKNYIFNR